MGEGDGPAAALSPADDDAALGAALKAGDAAGIAGLYEKYRHAIHEFAARVLDDRSRAEDVVQMTFMRAMERSETLRDPARVRTWLYGIALNLARDELTKNREARHAELSERTPAVEPEPEALALQHDADELVWAAVASLEPDQRIALELSVRHELSAREVAAALGVTAAEATLRTHRARSSFLKALRSLVVARSRTHCPGLAAMVPPGLQQLSPWLRRSVDHHMRRCAVCQSRAAALASPIELLGGIAFLPLPASLAHEWTPQPHAMPPAQTAGARLSWNGRWRSPAVVASGLTTLLLFGGGLGGALILHNRQHPATATAPHVPHASPVPSLDAVPTPFDTPLPPTPTPTLILTPTPTPSGAQSWAQAQALLRGARGYHVTYGSYYVYPAGGVAGNPLQFDLTVQPSGDFQGSYIAIDGFIGRFDLRRLGGVLAVRHIDTVGNFGNPNAPPDAMQFFGVTYDQANSLGDNWLPLTGSAQLHAASVLSAALANYISATAAADSLLAPPSGPLQVERGLDAGSTQISGSGRRLTFRVSPSPFVDLSVQEFEVRFDNLGG